MVFCNASEAVYGLVCPGVCSQVMYGMIFNHLGTPGDDENHYGAGEESAEIVIQDMGITLGIRFVTEVVIY